MRNENERYVWLENLGDRITNFVTPDYPKFQWAPTGYHNSVIQVPERVANNSFVVRAVNRGRLQKLSDRDAKERMKQLVDRGDMDSSDIARLQEALAEGASENISRYKKKDLSDDGKEMGTITQEQVWKDKKMQTVHRSESESGERQATELNAPLPPEQVLTQPVREGDWKTQTE